MGIAAPVISQEMAEWVALGGGNSGIVGNALHDYGYHVAADELPPSDYSRTNDPNGPNGPYVNWDYACAGDFSHANNESLRARHREVLARLMRGDFPMICEFIGKPWADRPVYYWFRPNGISNLQLYTGAGHDTWSHISWYRSKVNQRAYLWTPSSALTPPSKRNGDMRPFVIIQPTGPNFGIVLAWPSDVARGWVYTDLRMPGATADAPALVDMYKAAGCIDGRNLGIKNLNGYTNLADVPQAAIEVGSVVANLGPLNLSIDPIKGTLTPVVGK